MDEKINVISRNFSEFASKESECIADWVSEREVKSKQFIRTIADIVGNYFEEIQKI
ncbi:hypothetical protein P9265_16770 [Schinkia azotoformans]|uniref:hypothetical protein n=1 Tax=Schinkia azotoformans TaxID=1454 RepID=UPI002E216B06|nr:hypothetical protein [Schinkia azotoformans]